MPLTDVLLVILVSVVWSAGPALGFTSQGERPYRRKLGSAVFLCVAERRMTLTRDLGGIFEVFMEGVGHGNIVCYPKEHVILGSEKNVLAL